MNKYVLRIHHSVEDFQGYDPHEWTDEEVAETFEEAMLLMANTMWWSSDPFTLISFEILCGGDVVLRTGDMSPQLYFEAHMRHGERREKKMAESLAKEVEIDDDDMPF